MGTALEARGLVLPPPLWSAAALRDHPDAVAAVHRSYAAAGATVHTAATFRTTRRAAGADWRPLVHTAVALAREALPEGARLAGSIAPLEDCWRPELAPPPRVAAREHAALAGALVDEGCDLLLCETFACVAEGLAAVRAAVATGRPTWASFTPGYRGDLLSPAALAAGARAAAEAGAAAVLVNCLPARSAHRWLGPLRAAVAELGVPVGIYANAGAPGDGLGWGQGAAAHARLAQGWHAAGATILGGCCGTDAATVRALAGLVGDGGPG